MAHTFLLLPFAHTFLSPALASLPSSPSLLPPSQAFDEINTQTVYQCTGSPTPEVVESIMNAMLSDDFDGAFRTSWELMHDRGLALQDVLTALSELVVLLDVKDRMAKARLMASLADLEERLSVGTNEKLQLAGLVGLFVGMRPALIAGA